jgi:hypothetical protein
VRSRRPAAASRGRWTWHPRTAPRDHWTSTAKHDGKDNPVTGNNPFSDTIALTRVNPNTMKITVKQGGKPTVTQTIIIAVDGKTRTSHRQRARTSEVRRSTHVVL